jgi:hypothetical protein
VVVSYVDGSVTSDTADLAVSIPATIVQQPASQVVVAGTNVTFSVNATGTAPVTYQWLFNGQILPGQTNQTLTLVGVTEASNGPYSVLVSNPGGTIPSATANLTVAIAPSISRQPQAVTATVGGTAVFTVLASGTEPFTYQWFFGTQSLPGATGSTLTLTNVQTANAGGYSVVVSSVAGIATSATVPLNLNLPVTFTRQPESQTNTAGGLTIFSVVASGTAPLTYQWRFNDKDIVGATQSSYSIFPTTAESAGRYQVLVSNDSGPVLSDVAVLTVSQPVTILTQPQSVTVTNGGTAVFSAEFSGTGPFQFQWRFGSTALAPFAAAAGPTVSLTVPNVQVAQAGNYSVVIRNPVGDAASTPAVLRVLVPPFIQTQPAAQRVAPGNNVTFSVTAGGDAPLSYQWQKNGRNVDGATAPTLTLPSVQPGNSGKYRVVVQNAGGAVTSEAADMSLILPSLGASVTGSSGAFDGGNTTRGAGSVGLAVRKSVGSTSSETRTFSWTAPSSGIVTFNTIGSDFDTVISVYSGATNNLTLVASDDDSGGFFNSQVTFNAVQGTTYQIAIVGFSGTVGVGDVGHIVISFQLAQSVVPLPVITRQPQSQTVPTGSNVTFTVQAQGNALSYLWLVNGTPIPTATGPSLVIANVQESDAAQYTVKVSNGTTGAGQVTVESLPAILQIATVNTAFEDKFKNAPRLGGGAVALAGLSLQPILNSGGSVARGYSGSQVFNTFGSAKEQGEPNHAGEIGGASQWFTYQSPARGTLKVSTEGSDFDTVLAVYSGPGTDFSTLKEEAFDNDSGADRKTSVAALPVTAGASYFIAVDGVKGATGKVKLSYELGTGPVIAVQPANQSAILGTNVTFSVQLTNTLSAVSTNAPPLSYQWQRDGQRLVGETKPTLTIQNVQFGNIGDFAVIVSNFAGATTSSVARLTVNVPVAFTTVPQSQTAKAGSRAVFIVAASGSAPLTYQWRFNGTNIVGANFALLELNNVQSTNAGLYSVVVQNAAGPLESSAATLTVTSAPLITSPPASQSVSLGQNATLNVTAAGTGPFTYQWRFRSGAISGATASTLSLANVQLSDAGEYSVVVGNNVDSVISSPATLVVRAPLALTAAPQSRTVPVGSSTVFSVAANGTGPFNYQWRFNAANIPGATNANFTLANAQPADAGQYTVQVSVGAESVESPAAVLAVTVPPAISQQPQSQVVVFGTNVTFSVTAAGSGTLSYQWKFNGADIPGATNETFTLSNVQTASAGSYNVVVSNSTGSSASTAAVLTVLVAPTISQQPQALAVNVGTNATFSVTASGSGVLSYQWKFNGVDITGATSPTLTINNVQLANIGGYTVVISNSAGATTSTAAALTVLTAPIITQQPQSQTVNAGTNVIFSVSASGGGAISYQWKFNGADLPGATNATLTLNNVQAGSAGSYTVAVSNSVGATTSGTAVLTVLTAPIITQQPQSQSANAGTNVIFSVTASGGGTISFQWRFNGADIPGATNTTLTLNNVQTGSAGNYTVAVSNAAGSITSSAATLTVLTGPVITQQPQSQNVSEGATATFSVTATGAPPLSYQWLFNGAVVGGATNSTLSLLNVQAGNAGNYSVRVASATGSVTSSVAALTVGQLQLVSQAQIVGGVFQFRLTVPAGQQAVVQFSTDLVTWTNLSPTPIPSGTVDVRDDQAGSFGLRFYRVVLQ